MKKISHRLIAAAVVAAAGVSASADVLSPEEALGRALPQARNAAPALVKPVLAYTAEADELPAVYVFAKENKGFLLVSADDAVTPLLGYADNGSFDADNMAPAFKYWIGEYARQIAYARENATEGAPVRIARPKREPIAPLLETKWDQGNPYNKLCPTSSRGGITYTGCVATAASQVMKYFEWPKENPTGKIKYTSSIDGVPTELELDLSTVSLKWDDMLDSYTAAAPGTEAQQMAVAELMRAVGYAVDMNYGTAASGGSGAQTIKVSDAIVNNFGYDKSVEYLQRDCYTLGEWEEIIYNQLKTVGPVLYDGRTYSNEGHAYVCDGYDKEGYFHINWGWGGTSDGYFLLDALDPDTQGAGGAASGAGFNYGQDITINFKPEAGGVGVPSFTAQGTGLLIEPGEFNIGREVTVTYDGGGFYNRSYMTVTAKFGLHVQPTDGSEGFYRWSSTVLEDLATNYGAKTYNVLLSGIKENSSYILTPAFKVGDTAYPMGMPYGQTRAYALKTSVNLGVLTPVAIGFEVTDLSIPEEFKNRDKIDISAKFVNESDEYYYGHVAPVFLKKVYGEYEIVNTFTNMTVSLDPGESQEWKIENLRVTAAALGLEVDNEYYYAFINADTNKLVSSLVKFFYGNKPQGGISDVTADNSIVVITPNPADSYFTVEGVDVNTVNVYTSAGMLMVKANEATVDVAHLAAGFYLVEVVDNNGNRSVARLIKK